MPTEAERRLTEALLQERAQRARQATSITTVCFLCGRPFWPHRERFDEDDNGRFCSAKCRDWYDFDGARPVPPDPAPHTVDRWRVVAGGDPGYLARAMPMSSDGFRVSCRGCGREFVSKGFAYCSPECKTAARERKEAREVMGEGGVEPPVKRKCLECGGDIPNWRKGRRVASNTRFCSKGCKDKYGRKTRGSANKPA